MIKDGLSSLGRPVPTKYTDIPISGIGVAPEHNKVDFDEGTRQMFIHPNANPKKNKTYVNGKLVRDDTPLKHGDRVLFGNHNLYIVKFPGEELTPEMMDYENAMKEAL